MNTLLKRRIFWNLLDGSGFKVLEGCLDLCLQAMRTCTRIF